MNVPFLNRYRHGEFLQYVKDVSQLLSEQDMTALQLTAQYDALQPQVAAIDTAFKQNQASEITTELTALDNQRDDALTGLRSVINGYSYHYEQRIKDAAAALMANIDQHGPNVQRLSYQEETAVIDSITDDWQDLAELSQAVADLNLGKWLTHLQTTNASFATRYLARVERQAANPGENIPKLREAATASYRSLIAHLQAHATLNTAPQHAILLQQISVLAGQYNQVIENRASSNMINGQQTDTSHNSNTTTT
ncbi:DUF6261 family protein [Aquimarina sediminis]|uniref:DUF6261 family protein n=1 Tax=Aquimarina sediminis TaxID=2070536 RepID=UPI000CA04C57|nr:DUF6261 family protein [Aquimarina sediminis]